MSKSLKKLLKKCVIPEIQEPLAVADAKLGSMLKDKFNISCVHNSNVTELMRLIRQQLESLIQELPRKDLHAMALGLAHGLSRYKVKFSADKVDTMIIQAISLLDDLDKELNNYIMRCREWYSWHFPEINKLIQDHLAYARTTKIIGMRDNALKADLSDVLPEDLEKQVREASQISMGTEISDVDIENITSLCDQIIEMSAYRTQLCDYLKNRMMTLAPNLTILLGELIGARLISHAGSLINLAKYPASTVQILGAEKALFRALKTKKDTPKYGLIYHAQLLGQTPGKLKGKMSRMLAAKCALSCRVDALGEDNSAELGIEHRAALERRLLQLQQESGGAISGTGRQKAKFEKHKFKQESEPYNDAADSTLPSRKRPKIEELNAEEAQEFVGFEQSRPKKVKLEEPAAADGSFERPHSSSKKKKKHKREMLEESAVADEEVVVQEAEEQEMPAATSFLDQSGSAKKKKKKKERPE